MMLPVEVSFTWGKGVVVVVVPLLSSPLLATDVSVCISFSFLTANTKKGGISTTTKKKKNTPAYSPRSNKESAEELYDFCA